MGEQKKAISLAVGNQIRRYRYAKSISQEDLDLRANINPAYLGQVERGLKCATVDTLCKLFTALEILPSELLQFNSLYYRVVVIRVPSPRAVLQCKGCCGLVINSYRKTVPERLQPQPFTVERQSLYLKFQPRKSASIANTRRNFLLMRIADHLIFFD